MLDRAMIHVLGVVRCVPLPAGVPTPLQGAQPRLALARLAGPRDCPVTADELADLLWPAGTDYSAGALRGVVSKVRVALAAAFADRAHVENLGGSYLLVREDVQVDVEAADEMVHVAERLVAADAWADASEPARRAVELLRPPLLPGVEGRWVDRRRQELLRLHRRALCLAARIDTQLGAVEDAIGLAYDALHLDPYDEVAHRALITAHLRGGDRAGAMRAYEQCRRVLADELGLEPSPSTDALHQQLVRH